MDTVTLKIGGMACGGCAAAIRMALEQVPGVQAVEIALENAEAVVEFDPALASPARLCETVAAAGYRAETV